MKKRLDKALVDSSLVKTRSRAKDLISRGKILVNGDPILKASFTVSDDDSLEVTEKENYVSRGSHKLLGALANHPNFKIAGKVGADFGSSTGGFTQILLENGAQKIFAIDSGIDQLDESLRGLDHVMVMENTNLRDVTTLEIELDFCVGDLSFISLKLILPNVYSLLKDQGEALLLFKPQFEVGKKNLPRDGVVKDTALLMSVLSDFFQFCQSNKLAVKGFSKSQIEGKTGNREYFFHLQKNGEFMSEAQWEKACKVF